MSNGFFAPPVSQIVRPIPTVVIALGDFAAQTACQTRQLYLRGDARRPAACAFFQLAQSADSGLGFSPLGFASEEKLPPAGEAYLEKRQTALRLALEHGIELKSELESLLHERRTHERLIEAGWEDPYNIPLNFFILADAADPFAAGLLLPLLAVLNEIASTTNFCRVHLLLATGVFPGDAPQLDLAVGSLLQALDDFLRPDSPRRKQLAKKLRLLYAQAPNFNIFLFDSRKDGTAMVSSRQGLSTLVGNALLALLQNDLAGRFFQEQDPDVLFEYASYYSSLGTAALIYTPDALQSACSRRAGYQFLTEQILPPAGDSQAAIQHAHLLCDALGGLDTWQAGLVEQLPLSAGSVHLDPQTGEMSAGLTEADLPPMDIEDVRGTPWQALLEEHEARFTTQDLPRISQKLNDNLAVLAAQLGQKLAEEINALPLNVKLYPGGLDNAGRVLDLCAQHLEQAASGAEKLANQVRRRAGDVKSRLADLRQELGKLLASAPALPWWIRVLPGFLRRWLAPIYMMRRYGVSITRATLLRDECLKLLNLECGLNIQLLALDGVRGFLPGLQDQLKRAQADLDALKQKHQTALLDFRPDWEAFPLKAAENGFDPVFRLPAVERRLADWAYRKWLPDFKSWLPDFLQARPLFADWRAADAAQIAAWVFRQGGQAYKPLWEVTLEEIFQLWDSGQPGFDDPKPLTARTIANALAASVPPARPSFDAAGGAPNAQFTCHGLTGYPDWLLCRLPEHPAGNRRWEAVYTGDPYSALFIQTIRGFPLAALVDSFDAAWKTLRGLPFDQRLAYDLLAALEQTAPIPIPVLDPNDPDLEHKTFRWKFRPKGSNKEFEQELTLALSKSRYEYYRRQPRLSGKWNVYAELEMPEVRQLATAFQSLHARHKWSTFNQAFNVLKFVQSCIPYAYDRDTTGQEDWARYPIETLVDGHGDCEDVAILCAAVIARLGFQVVLLLYPNPSHLAFGVAGADNLRGDYIVDPRTGLRYFYGEATSDGWHLGEIPERYRGQPPEEILPVTILIGEE